MPNGATAESEKLKLEITKLVNDSYNQYRHVAIQATATVVALASVILGWLFLRLNDFLAGCSGLKTIAYLLGFLPLAISITTSVLVQYLIFRGYYKQANIMGRHFGLQTPDTGSPNIDLGHADTLCHVTVGSFLLGFVVVVVLLSIKYFL